MTVYTHEYEWTHGRKPRGRGWWMFFCQVGSEYPEVNFPGTLYIEAKKQAIKWCKEIGGIGLTVMP